MKKGAAGGNLDTLSEEEAQRIHQASISLLEDPGIFSESDLFLDIFQKGGARVDRDSRVIRVPPDMVEAALESTPRSFVLHGRHDPDMDMLIEPGRVYYGMGGTSEPHIWDYDLLKPRHPTKADVVASTRIGHALPNIDVVQGLCMSGDKQPPDVIFYHDYDAILRNTTKPTVISVLDRPFTVRCLEIAAAASGGEDELRQRPSILAMLTPVTPLRIGAINEGLIDAVEAGVPILYSPGAMMGATGPATVAGTLVLVMAAQLFGLVLTHLLPPAIPVALTPDTNALDIRATARTSRTPAQPL
nr:trimethylamine methyltransferase family protein [Ardenticatenia bacterium]